MGKISGDPATGLLRAIGARFAPGSFRLEDMTSRDWASVTFSGARHRLCFRGEGDAADGEADAFAIGLGAAELDVRGHIVADVALSAYEPDGDGVRIIIEALTVEDCCARSRRPSRLNLAEGCRGWRAASVSSSA